MSLGRIICAGRIAPQLRIKSGVRDDHRPGRDLESGLRGLHIGMSKIDQDAQPIAFLDDGRPECGQSAKANFRSTGQRDFAGGVSKHIVVDLRGMLKKAGSITGCPYRRPSEDQRYDGRDCQPGTFQYTEACHQFSSSLSREHSDLF